ncbi:MAG: NAD(+)/NADH kinase [Clostridiales bacterium]|nr:NAD(+)/NADH kinase [Clostridiales bacterium]
MKIGLFVNSNRDIGYECAYTAAQSILRYGAVPVLRPSDKGNFPHDLAGVVFEDFDKAGAEVLVSIGGDGTFLSMVAQYGNSDYGFVGINKGNLGFLAKIGADNIDENIRRIVERDYKLINRSRLNVKVFSKDGVLKAEDVCLNDCSLSRGAKLHVARFLLKVNGQVVERIFGDGLVVSTATGSTSYSLSAGGPILMPELRNIIITTVCSRTLHSYTYVLSPESTVEVVIEKFETRPLICLDGHDLVDLESDDVVSITVCDKDIKAVDLTPDGFFADVRHKIIQRGSLYENN